MCMAEPAVCWVPALQMHRSAPYHFLILLFHYNWTALSISIYLLKSVKALCLGRGWVVSSFLAI